MPPTGADIDHGTQAALCDRSLRSSRFAFVPNSTRPWHRRDERYVRRGRGERARSVAQATQLPSDIPDTTPLRSRPSQERAGDLGHVVRPQTPRRNGIDGTSGECTGGGASARAAYLRRHNCPMMPLTRPACDRAPCSIVSVGLGWSYALPSGARAACPAHIVGRLAVPNSSAPSP